jgi:uncharacterized protein YqgV (UPF0045/DUF77 family)
VSTVSLQVSIYPLRQPELGPAITKFLEAFRSRGLDVRPGTMSTLVVGETDAVLDGLKAAFRAAAELGDVVLAVTISNCCPLPAAHADAESAP